VSTDKIKYSILTCLLLLTGCFPKDELVVPLKLEIVEIPYSMYDTQAWYNIHNKTVVSHNSFNDWDLGFESNGSGHHIILNTSRFMHAGKTGSSDFYGTTTNTCDTMVYDDSSGDLNKTAIGNWADFSDPMNPVYPREVYIIDLGTDNNGVRTGYKKITFDSLAASTYSVHFSNLDGSDEHNFDIVADPSRSFTLFSFKDGGNVFPLQPPDKDWDICFTQYSTILFDDKNVATPYLVRGVYINMEGTSAARDTLKNFNDITSANIPDYTFSSAQDAIGYDWKDYKNDSYMINPGIFYIIKDQNGEYFKMKFTGFYNKSGERGYPSFQCIGLAK
jgi:HmuY protein